MEKSLIMKDFITTVKAMREAQKEYFRTRDRQVLQRSKALEKRVDALIAEYDNKPKGLFDTEKPLNPFRDKMDLPIGGVLEMDDIKYTCVEGSRCEDCAFFSNASLSCEAPDMLLCTDKNRKDHINVIFIKREGGNHGSK